MSLLSVKNLSIGYQTPKGMLRAVDNASFSLDQGRPLGIVGESGCGKTTMGMALMGLLPENGRILGGRMEFMGRNLTDMSREEWQKIRGKEIAMVFQAAMNALNPVFRVDDQVQEAIRVHEPDISRSDLDRRVKALFDLVEIPQNRLGSYPHEYSGGMKQRAVIAMALACSPRLIIADEPTTALDVIVQDQILTEMRRIQEKTRTGLIFISHDIAVIASVCEDVCVMYGGQIVEKGQKLEVFSSPAHPYTRTLLGSYLSLDNVDKIRIPDRLHSPDLVSGEPGCRFAANCRSCSAGCGGGVRPGWVELSPTHGALCCDENLIRKMNG